MTEAPKATKGPSDEQKRQIVLAAVATVLIVVFAIVHFAKQSANAVAVVAEHGVSARDPVNPPPALGEDEKKWQAHYKPILDAEPFRERTFHTRAQRLKPGDKGYDPNNPNGNGETAAVPSSSGSGSSVGMMTLVLTGLMSQGQTAYAMFESRGTGKGVFLKVGDKVGTNAVAAISTDTLFLAPASTAATGSSSTTMRPDGIAPPTSASIAPTDSRGLTQAPPTPPTPHTAMIMVAFTPPPGSVSVRIGSSFDVKPGDIVIETLGSATVGASGTIIPKLSEERKLSVLEQLRQKRRASLGGGT